jgi:TPR repeat protein
MKSPTWTIALLFGFGSILVAQDFDDGFKAYSSHDYAEAIRIWKPLAEKGGSAAQFNLGLLYYEGQGVPQNYSEAAKWFRLAADQDYLKAQLNLGAMYGVGKGVKRDYVQSYTWLSICAAKGDDKCAAQRDLVAAKLSRSKLAAAQQQAANWKPQTTTDK